MMNMKITLLTGKTFDIAKEVGFDIEVVVSKRAKLLGLRIDAKKRLPALTLPKICSKRYLSVFRFLYLKLFVFVYIL